MYDDCSTTSGRVLDKFQSTRLRMNTQARSVCCNGAAHSAPACVLGALHGDDLLLVLRTFTTPFYAHYKYAKLGAVKRFVVASRRLPPARDMTKSGVQGGAGARVVAVYSGILRGAGENQFLLSHPHKN